MSRIPRIAARIAVVLLAVLAFSAISQAKVRIAVAEFYDKTNNSYMSVGRGIADILTTELVKTGNFDVVERERLESLMDEQGLALTGMVDPATAAQVQKLLGVQAILMGSVTQFTINTTSVNLPFLGRVTNSEARVEIQLRLTDTTTGAIKLADSALGTESAGSFVLNMEQLRGISLGSQNFADSILGKATNKAVAQLVAKVSAAFPVEGYVLTYKDGRLYTDLGSEKGVRSGNKVRVVKESESLVHPITKEVIPGERRVIATLTVERVTDKMGICVFDAQPSENIYIGDKVVLVQ